MYITVIIYHYFSNVPKNSDHLKEMKVLWLSYLYINLDKEVSEMGAGDLATSSLNTGFSEGSIFHEHVHILMSNVDYFQRTYKWNSPRSSFRHSFFFIFPKNMNFMNEILNEDLNTLDIHFCSKIPPF